MAVKALKIAGTDSQYEVHEFNQFLGKVSKCWTGRSSYLWVIDPQIGVPCKTRVGYDTKKEAVAALVAFHESCGTRRSLVTG